LLLIVDVLDEIEEPAEVAVADERVLVNVERPEVERSERALAQVSLIEK
jgi:hypothetical protein